VTVAVATIRPHQTIDTPQDVPAVLLLLQASGIDADRIHVQPDLGTLGLSVQVRSGWGTRPSATAVRLLRTVGATTDLGWVVEPEGREYSGRTPDGTWVYIPCRPLTPLSDIHAGRGATTPNGDPQ
jgi:hypothetical protein